MKNSLKNVPVGTIAKSKTKKGSTTPKAKKARPTPRFYDVKIRMTVEEYARGLPHFGELKYLPRFVLDAYIERVNRAEANSKAARLRILAGHIELLKPILKEMFLRGDLDFLKEHLRGEVDG